MKSLNKFYKLAGLFFIIAVLCVVVGLILIGTFHYGDGKLAVTGFDIIKGSSIGEVLKVGHDLNQDQLVAGIVFAVILAPIFVGLSLVAFVIKHFKK